MMDGTIVFSFNNEEVKVIKPSISDGLSVGDPVLD